MSVVMKSFFSAIGTFFGNLALRYGVLGLAIGMFAESLGIPTASVVLELTAGPLIIAGKTTFIEAVIFATAGLTLGSVVSYYMGYFGADLGKKLLNRGGKKAKQQQSRFTDFLKKRGDISILFAQLFGTARTWISIPAGAIKMDIRRFTIYTAIGGAVYCSLAIGFSLALTSLFRLFYMKLVQMIRSPIVAGGIIFAIVGLLIVAFYLILARFRGNSNSESNEKNL